MRPGSFTRAVVLGFYQASALIAPVAALITAVAGVWLSVGLFTAISVVGWLGWWRQFGFALAPTAAKKGDGER